MDTAFSLAAIGLSTASLWFTFCIHRAGNMRLHMYSRLADLASGDWRMGFRLLDEMKQVGLFRHTLALALFRSPARLYSREAREYFADVKGFN